MVRWIVSFVVVFAFLVVLFYVVRVRTRPEDEIKERRHAAVERRRTGGA